MSDEKSAAKCPFHHATGRGTSNRDWWPNQLRLDLLHQHSSKSNPMGESFDYRSEFQSLDYAALKEDAERWLTGKRWQLLEAFGEALCRHMLEHPIVKRVELTVDKPAA